MNYMLYIQTSHAIGVDEIMGVMISIKKIIKTQSRTLTFKKIFAKLKFSPALFEKTPSFVCLVFKIENK